MWMTEIVIGILFYIFVIDVVFSSCMKMVNMKEKVNLEGLRQYKQISTLNLSCPIEMIFLFKNYYIFIRISILNLF